MRFDDSKWCSFSAQKFTLREIRRPTLEWNRNVVAQLIQ